MKEFNLYEMETIFKVNAILSVVYTLVLCPLTNYNMCSHFNTFKHCL